MFNRLSLAAAAIAAPAALLGAQFVSAAPVANRIAIAVNLAAEPDAAARTWRFEVVDAAGSVVRTVVVPLSGDAPSGVAAVDGLPEGDYAVRPVLSSDLGLACSGSALFSVDSASTAVTSAAGGSGVAFTITPCTAIAAVHAQSIAVTPPTEGALLEVTPAPQSFAGGSGATVDAFATNLTRALTVLPLAAAISCLKRAFGRGPRTASRARLGQS